MTCVQCIQRDPSRDLLQRGLNGRERLAARGRHAARLVRAPVCALTLLAAVLDTLAACTPLERRVDTTTVRTPHTHPAAVERCAAAPRSTRSTAAFSFSTLSCSGVNPFTHTELLFALMSCTLARGGTSAADRSAPSSHQRPPGRSVPSGAPPCSHHHHRWKRRRWRRTVLASVSRPACPDKRRAVAVIFVSIPSTVMSASLSAPTSTNTLGCLHTLPHHRCPIHRQRAFAVWGVPSAPSFANARTLFGCPLSAAMWMGRHPKSSCVSTSTPPATRLLICATLPSVDAFISSLNTPVVMERTRMNGRPSAKRPSCSET